MDIKPGWETTEFWVTVFTSIIGILLAAGVITPAQATAASQNAATWAGLALTAITAIAYVISRTVLKHHSASIVADAATLARVTATTPDPAAGLADTPPAPSYASPAARQPIKVPTAIGFTDPASAPRASSL